MRHKILFFALSAALVLGCISLVVEENCLKTETIFQPVSAPLAQAEAEAAVYLVKAHQGQVCIYQGEELLSPTGILLSSLPQQDQALLEEGIPAQDSAALAALLEDLGA